jgi:hypothetical protein
MTKSRKNWLFVLVAAGAASLVGWTAGQPQMDSLQGYYSSPSKQCTEFSEEKNDFVSCEKEFEDCLSITKIDQKSAEVEIYSTQANQHSCATRGTATFVNGRLVLPLDAEGKDQHLELVSKKDGVHIEEFVPKGQHVVDCGAHADFAGLSFKKIDSDVGKHSCFKG